MALLAWAPPIRAKTLVKRTLSAEELTSPLAQATLTKLRGFPSTMRLAVLGELSTLFEIKPTGHSLEEKVRSIVKQAIPQRGGVWKIQELLLRDSDQDPFLETFETDFARIARRLPSPRLTKPLPFSIVTFSDRSSDKMPESEILLYSDQVHITRPSLHVAMQSRKGKLAETYAYVETLPSTDERGVQRGFSRRARDRILKLIPRSYQGTKTSEHDLLLQVMSGALGSLASFTGPSSKKAEADLHAFLDLLQSAAVFGPPRLTLEKGLNEGRHGPYGNMTMLEDIVLLAEFPNGTVLKLWRDATDPHHPGLSAVTFELTEPPDPTRPQGQPGSIEISALLDVEQGSKGSSWGKRSGEGSLNIRRTNPRKNHRSVSRNYAYSVQ